MLVLRPRALNNILQIQVERIYPFEALWEILTHRPLNAIASSPFTLLGLLFSSLVLINPSQVLIVVDLIHCSGNFFLFVDVPEVSD
jgi:hypothetical protein